MNATIVCVLALSARALAQPVLEVVEPASGFASTSLSALSLDGAIAAGSMRMPAGASRAMRWMRASGPEDLGVLPGDTDSAAAAISDDGSTIVGRSWRAGAQRAFRWTSVEGMSDLGSIAGGHTFVAVDATADGSTIVGNYRADEWPQQRSFVWTAAGGMTRFEVAGQVRAISGDGGTIVGIREYGWYRWTGTTQAFGSSPCGPLFQSFAVGADANEVVGYAYDFNPTNAGWGFRWTAWAGCGYFGVGFFSQALSATGWIAGGGSLFIPGIGRVTLADYLTAAGVPVSTSTLASIAALSASGRTIVGNDLASLRGWWVHLPEGSLCYANCDDSTASPFLDVADFACFLGRFAAGDTRANCDGSMQTPRLNIADYTCFINLFARGCP